MKNVALNTLGYTGIVTLSRYIGDKKVKIAELHNTGGKVLFDFLSDCLIGDFESAKITRPSKIMLLQKDIDATTNSVTYKSVSGFLSITTLADKAFSTNEGGSITYSFKLNRDQLLRTTFDHIGLYAAGTDSQDLNNYVAICPMSLSTSEISMSASVVLEWKLIITNNSSSNT